MHDFFINWVQSLDQCSISPVNFGLSASERDIILFNNYKSVIKRILVFYPQKESRDLQLRSFIEIPRNFEYSPNKVKQRVNLLVYP